MYKPRVTGSTDGGSSAALLTERTLGNGIRLAVRTERPPAATVLRTPQLLGKLQDALSHLPRTRRSLRTETKNESVPQLLE